jgi:hypothetical protein
VTRAAMKPEARSRASMALGIAWSIGEDPRLARKIARSLLHLPGHVDADREEKVPVGSSLRG